MLRVKKVNVDANARSNQKFFVSRIKVVELPYSLIFCEQTALWTHERLAEVNKDIQTTKEPILHKPMCMP